MDYSKEEIKDLIETLYGYEGKYDTVADFLKGHYEVGLLDFGFKDQGTIGSIMAIDELKEYFPDVYYALIVDKKDLPLYAIDEAVGQEYPIACWRIKLGR